MKKTLGVLAHVDTGKTTFCEQFLFHTNNIKTRGRVDNKNSFMDTHDIEKSRGITVFSDHASIDYNGSTYYLIDTPGHVDFSPEMERAIKIMDYAIVLVSAVEGVQGHTEMVWNLLKKNGVPTFFFINKTDRVGADVERVLQEIRENLIRDIYQIEKAKNYLNDDSIEFMAERDEEYLEKYLSGEDDNIYWENACKTLIKANKLSICMSGSALQDEGVFEFINIIDALTFTQYNDSEEFAAKVYKIRHDKDGARITFMKILSGRISVRNEVSYCDNEIKEKITQIRIYHGDKYEKVNSASAGDIIAVMGLTKANTGDGIGALVDKSQFEDMTTLKSKVILESNINSKEALRDFYILNTEEASLKVEWEEKSEDIHVHVMGVIQLEVLQQLVKDRFGYDISFGNPEVIYKETIAESTTGYGHFEPIGHYAEVHLRIEPNPRGSGITFENKCHADMLTGGNQNLVHMHIFEREHHGLLTGSAITDVKITLLTGKAHNKHTSGGDFREATCRALRQGLEKVENILLEPYYDFKIKVEQDYMGRVISDIQKYCGEFETPIVVGKNVMIAGHAPVSTFINYSNELLSFTKGKGKMSLKFCGYKECHNQEESIEKVGYDKSADRQYVSSSIFCSKGKAYSLKWDECENEMHCLK